MKLLASAKVRDKFCACIECFLFTDVNFLVQCMQNSHWKLFLSWDVSLKLNAPKFSALKRYKKINLILWRMTKANFIFMHKRQESRRCDTKPLEVRCHEMENIFLSTSVPKKFSGKNCLLKPFSEFGPKVREKLATLNPAAFSHLRTSYWFYFPTRFLLDFCFFELDSIELFIEAQAFLR